MKTALHYKINAKAGEIKRTGYISPEARVLINLKYKSDKRKENGTSN